MTTSRGGRYGPTRAPRRGQRQVMQPNAARTLGVFLAVPGYSRAGAVSLNHTGGGHSMRAFAAPMLLLSLCAAPLAAQGGMGGGQYTPPPDHWLTADSLKAALALTPAEVQAIKPAYDSINVILKQAATVRDSVRAAMQGMQEMSMEDRRAKMAPVRVRMEAIHAPIAGPGKSIRAKLTPHPPPNPTGGPHPPPPLRPPHPPP